MPWLPQNDGVDHINVYSRSETLLGRRLSNFAYTPFECEDGCFDSIEGYWYWLSCRDDRLRKSHGYQAKKLGRELGAKDWLDDGDFKRKICDAIRAKVDQNLTLQEMFLRSSLPLAHYYNYGGKIVDVKEGEWILQFLEELRRELQS